MLPSHLLAKLEGPLSRPQNGTSFRHPDNPTQLQARLSQLLHIIESAAAAAAPAWSQCKHIPHARWLSFLIVYFLVCSV